MTRHAPRTIATWIAAAASVLHFAASGSARAGDNADKYLIGFSPDGAYFAFEEYGVEDGSGFPYSAVYVIEVAGDRWLPGTPIRFRIDDEQASLAQARGETSERAAPLLDQYQIGRPGLSVVDNPLTEALADPFLVAFHPRSFFLSNDVPYQLTLEEYVLPAPNCPDIGQGDHRGFRLVLTDPEGATRTLSEDAQIPASRFCPLNYGISEVVTYPLEAGGNALVVLLNVFSVGFEGPDRRFIAVTTTID